MVLFCEKLHPFKIFLGWKTPKLKFKFHKVGCTLSNFSQKRFNIFARNFLWLLEYQCSVLLSKYMSLILCAATCGQKNDTKITIFRSCSFINIFGYHGNNTSLPWRYIKNVEPIPQLKPKKHIIVLFCEKLCHFKVVSLYMKHPVFPVDFYSVFG